MTSIPGCPWVYLVKRPNGHDGMPLGIFNETLFYPHLSIL